MTIANSIVDPKFVILENYEKIVTNDFDYQSEEKLESVLVQDLAALGYEVLTDVKNPNALRANLRKQIERLNNYHFTDDDWDDFLKHYIDKQDDTPVAKAKIIHNELVFDLKFRDGDLKNIYILDKEDLSRNHLQVIRQFKNGHNRYDVTILVNGLPLVQIELKKRGASIQEAFNQMARYANESFNMDSSLFKYLQVFIISNGTDTRYFANTSIVQSSGSTAVKNSFDFTINWAQYDNTLIQDLKDFTATFLQPHTLLSVITKYSVLDSRDVLLLLRPYQIAATERIIDRIQTIDRENQWGTVKKGGFIWHTTGSGKTLTSFKAACLAKDLECVDKVVFVVDRKDLDHQTLIEYKRFDETSVIGSNSTNALRNNLENNDNKIVVTTIQKLNHLIKQADNLEIYQRKVVFIFDECHRSQFGEAQRNINHKFKNFCQFGFTGTPIFEENSFKDSATTNSVFGDILHSYVITDAIRDKKVLTFKVDYHNVYKAAKNQENIRDEDKLADKATRQMLLHPERIKAIAKFMLEIYGQKTHRSSTNSTGFNAMFAVDSVEAAKKYYETFKQLQAGAAHPLRIATIFSYAANERPSAIGEIADETLEMNTSKLSGTSKEFLKNAIRDYNNYFNTAFDIDQAEGFQNYYRDLSSKVKERQIDLLIVVGMFLTGFDAPRLNTLFVDKNLSYHGLIQAFSRTNRIYDATKSCGNVVCFRNLEEATVQALKLFANHKSFKGSIDDILTPSLDKIIFGYEDNEGNRVIGLNEASQAVLESKSKSDSNTFSPEEFKEFKKNLHTYLDLRNRARNYYEFNLLEEQNTLQHQLNSTAFGTPEYQQILERSNEVAQKAVDLGFDLTPFKDTKILTPKERQDLQSIYLHNSNEYNKNPILSQDQEEDCEVTFEIEFLKTQDITIDYICQLLFEEKESGRDKQEIKETVSSIVNSSLEYHPKTELISDFIEQGELKDQDSPEEIFKSLQVFADHVCTQEIHTLIQEEQLKPDEAKEYIERSLSRGYAEYNGDELSNIIPRTQNPLTGNPTQKKKSVWQKIQVFVDKFKGLASGIW
ncbi:type I restriction endonuclease subunit R [Psittacicella hinzii]|uniref:Type I restriction enzyme endonuclease subunit n=1 Tax=Psittacicella hinzii TaxID=2028575 RepID=A0A3A1YGK8_9GAMM|nr:type I restriction endonuclease subunit R [Psittacicella hinzii]RIY36815.1 hypothetical protein CKF58_05580 [Psittacicella hinzii]